MEKYKLEKAERDFIEKSQMAIAVYQMVDRRVVTLALSDGFCKLFGIDDRDEAVNLMDTNMYRDAHPDDVVRISEAAFKFAVEGGSYETIYRNKSPKDSEYKVIHSVGYHKYTNENDQLAYIWYMDEGEYVETGEEYSNKLNRLYNDAMRRESMTQMSTYDSLTGLPNTAYFFQLSEAGRDRLLSEGKQPAMVYFDLNGMTGFNNRYGFEEGNKLLKAFADLLVKYFSKENCGRFGQDHFLAYTDNAGLKRKLGKLFDELKTINDGKTLTIRVGIFLKIIGVTLDTGVACDRAKAAADSITDLSESAFRYYDKKMEEEINHRQYITDNFERAMEEGWITVYYQPLVRSSNGKVCDEEALSRWIDPDKGMIPPNEFIPILEAAHLTYKLDLYVLEKVLTKIRKLMQEGLYAVPQSINLSRYDFHSCDIVEEIRRRVDEAGVGREKITIEITESVIGSDFEFMKKQVERFHELGFNVWMDDFGSDYSSLDFLQSIPFDLIKLDIRFMQQFHDSEKTKIILTELVRMALNLGLETVCEGVEDEEQVQFLQEIGCSKLQGYYYCKAIPPEEIIERNRLGIQIGFENPDEANYYKTLGQINLYDISQMGGDETESLKRYFDTPPMAIVEIDDEGYEFIRSNSAFREFRKNVAPKISLEFEKAMRRCAREGVKMIVDRVLDNGLKVHNYLKRVAVNPVTGKASILTTILSVGEKGDETTVLTYASIARALASDYFNLFYVNTETDEFVEYRTVAMYGDVDAERHGTDFFNTAREDAKTVIYKEDLRSFLSAFTKDIVMRAIDRTGTFKLTYRQMHKGEPVYVSMKATRITNDDRHIIIGVNNVDVDMKHKAAMETIKEERKAYSLIRALSGDFIGFYIIDPETGEYTEHTSTEDYSELEIPQSGKDFFAESRKEAVRVIYNQDLEYFLSEFTKEKIMSEILNNRVFSLQYRLMVDGQPKYVSFKASLTSEREKPMIAAGVIDVDSRVKLEKKAEKRMTDTMRLSLSDLETHESRLQSLVDMTAKPCAVISVERLEDGNYGEVRIVCANTVYKETMGGGFYENMPYYELVPKDVKFEDYCYHSAILGESLRTYVETRSLGGWTDMQLIPLSSDSDDIGYCQFIFEFTKTPEASRMSQVSVLTADIVIEECIKLMGSDDMKAGVDAVLEDVRAMADAFSCRLILVDDTREIVRNYSCTIKKGVTGIGMHPDETHPYEVARTWSNLVSNNNVVIIKSKHDMELLRETAPLWADHLEQHGIESIILVPLYNNKVPFGYLYIANYSVDKTIELKETLELLSFFLASEISNRLLLEKMENMSYKDALTGINNRNAMLETINEYNGGCFGVLSIDLNGLKRTNDFYGHDVGDRMLIQAAEVLKKVFYEDDLFRTGGDEFIVIIPNISEVVFYRKLEKFISDSEKNMEVSFAIGSFWSDGSVLPAVALKMADDRMYADKREYYRQHPELSTR